MKNLFEKTNFILDGGVLVLLSEYLADRASRGVIARPDGNDLAVLDAFGTPMNSLFLEGAAGAVDAAFPSPPLRTSFDVLSAPLSGEWPWAVRLRGMGWCFYVLLGEEPTPEILEEMPSFAGLINLWQLHQKTAGVEERLSRLAYMVLATKNTLASVFEPMGVNYFGAFLHDVVQESLFPSRFSLLLDNGETLSLLEGEEMLLPPRKGIFSRDILSPVPVRVESQQRELLGDSVFDSLADDWSALLPIPGGTFRLFCFLKWDRMPGEEAFNFMELLGNVASKALSLGSLREERELNISELTRRAFLLNALHEAALQQRLHHAIHAHATNLLDLSAGDGLPIRQDGQGFERGLREPRRASFYTHERPHPRGEVRLRDELPRAGHANEPVAALGGLVLLCELRKRRFQVGFLDPAEDAGRLGGVVATGSSNQHVPQFFRRERLLRGEQKRFQNEFQFHATETGSWPVRVKRTVDAGPLRLRRRRLQPGRCDSHGRSQSRRIPPSARRESGGGGSAPTRRGT